MAFYQLYLRISAGISLALTAALIIDTLVIGGAGFPIWAGLLVSHLFIQLAVALAIEPDQVVRRRKRPVEDELPLAPTVGRLPRKPKAPTPREVPASAPVPPVGPGSNGSRAQPRPATAQAPAPPASKPAAPVVVETAPKPVVVAAPPRVVAKRPPPPSPLPQAPERTGCSATTKAGKPCKNRARPAATVCGVHAPRAP